MGKTEAVDVSTEDKIKNAARIVFHKKGYAATRTRDIAEEAGINLALLNYYFRSKEKLFKVIVLETTSDFFGCVIGAFKDENTTFEKKIEVLVENYITMFTKKPDILFFILSEIRNRPEDWLSIIPARQMLTSSAFIRQFQEKVAAGEIKEPNPLHFVMNLLGLTAFPILAKPFLSAVADLSDKQFNRLMQERKKMIPVWMEKMMKMS
jgi:AcrR family transcriptional regulator